MDGVTVVEHPLVQHKLTLMRDKNRSTKAFRQLLHEIGMLLCYEVTRDLPLEAVDIEKELYFAIVLDRASGAPLIIASTEGGMDIETVAESTIRCLKRHVPPAVPGIAFLSGGQSSTEATLHLSLMNKLGPLPWNLTFSYGRALQDDALKAWGGATATFGAGQKAFAKRARLNGLATTGRYTSDQESQAA